MDAIPTEHHGDPREMRVWLSAASGIDPALDHRQGGETAYQALLGVDVDHGAEGEAVLARGFERSGERDARLTLLLEPLAHDLLDDALLVASELAANAVTHADSACRIRLSVNAATLRIDVIDTGAGTPEPQPTSWMEEHGRGLHLVDALTTAWGLEVVPEGKVVWAELPRPTTGLAHHQHR